MVRTIFTTITPLPPGVSRFTVLETFHDHLEMIDLNPSHTTRQRIASPPEATPEEYHCTWYQITDKVSYFPGVKGSISFKACFHDLSNGLQTHVYAPMGLDIKEKWTLGGNEPGEPVQPAEIGIGAPISGLYIREDVEMRCNFLMTRFVRRTLKDSLATLVARLLVKSQLQEAVESNRRLTSTSSAMGQYAHEGYDGYTYPASQPGSPRGKFPVPASPPMSPPLSPPLSAGFDMSFPKRFRSERNSEMSQLSQQTYVSEMDGKGKARPPHAPAELMG